VERRPVSDPVDDATFEGALRRVLGREVAEALLIAAADEPGVAFVGGWVRDVLLDRRSDDVDLVAPDADRFVEALRAGGIVRRVVLLDAERRTFRVVLGGGRYVDVAALRGSLDEDLGQRDLRINAMAWLPGRGLRDPLDGRRDLADGRLRPTGPEALTDDPLRALRLWRFALELGLEPEEALPNLDLSGVSPERSRVELERILAADDCPRALAALDAAGLLDQVLPGPLRLERFAELRTRSWRSASVRRCLRHGRRHLPWGMTAVHLGWLCPADRLEDHLADRRWPRRTARAAALTSSQVGVIGDDVVADLVAWRDLAAWGLLGRAAEAPDSEAAVAAHLAALDRCAADATAARTVPELPAPLLPGDEVRELLGLEPGPKLGWAMRALVAAHLAGEIADRSEARSWLEER
jgi:poly(A) polymerase